jgi:hypothetical protein
MNWEAIGAIGEVVGAAGIIFTLVYLALQIRQNSQDVRSATRQSISTAQSQVGLQIATDPVLRAAAARWLAGEKESDDPEDLLVDDVFIRSNMRQFENQYYQHQEGTFSDEMWPGYVESMYRTMRNPIFHRWWENNRKLYSGGFTLFVDEQVSKSRGSSTSEDGEDV